MRATIAAGRRPGTRNHAFPWPSAVLPGAWSQTAEEDETQTGWRFIIYLLNLNNIKRELLPECVPKRPLFNFQSTSEIKFHPSAS